MIRLQPITPALLTAVKAAMAEQGCTVRLRKLSGSLTGRVRLVITKGTQADARDALVLLGALDSCGKPFTHPDQRYAWQSPVEVNVCFPA
jgi:hypothetical protein